MKFWRLCALVFLGLGASTSQAALFEDDEARRAILDLRQRWRLSGRRKYSLPIKYCKNHWTKPKNK